MQFSKRLAMSKVVLGNLMSCTRSETVQFFFDLNKFVYIFGLPSFWVEGVGLSDNFTKFYDQFTKICNLCVFVLVLSEYGAFFTQNNLSQKQSSDLLLFSISHAIITYFRVRVAYHKDEIRDVTYTLAIALKQVHNNCEVEKHMIRKSKLNAGALVLNCFSAVLFLTYEACVHVVRSGK